MQRWSEESCVYVRSLLWWISGTFSNGRHVDSSIFLNHGQIQHEQRCSIDEKLGQAMLRALHLWKIWAVFVDDGPGTSNIDTSVIVACEAGCIDGFDDSVGGDCQSRLEKRGSVEGRMIKFVVEGKKERLPPSGKYQTRQDDGQQKRPGYHHRLSHIADWRF